MELHHARHAHLNFRHFFLLPPPLQFHDFTLFRAKVQAKSDEEAGAAEDKAQLAENPQIWNVHIVLNVLHSLVNKSNINDQLEVCRRARTDKAGNLNLSGSVWSTPDVHSTANAVSVTPRVLSSFVFFLFLCGMQMFKQGGDPREVAGPFGARPLYQMLGYFSLVGLLRLQALLGMLSTFPYLHFRPSCPLSSYLLSYLSYLFSSHIPFVFLIGE